jgi:predicted RNA-binding Zn ribbon-like protein
MAQRGQDLLSKLADRGEEAFKKLPDMPGASRFLDATTNLRERVDELQRRMRGLEDLTKRVEALERRLDSGSAGGSGGKSSPRTTGAAARGTAEQTRKRGTRAKSSTPKRSSGGSGSGSGSGAKS